MSSFVYIELDTQAPKVDIYSPSYTIPELTNTITIESDEYIYTQNIYIIDSNGVKRNYTFKQEEANILVGEVSFFGYPFGIATIYASLSDDVENISNVVMKDIAIKESHIKLKLDIGDGTRELNINSKCQDTDIADRSMPVAIVANNEMRGV